MVRGVETLATTLVGLGVKTTGGFVWSPVLSSEAADTRSYGLSSKGQVTGETLIKKRFYMYTRREVDSQMKARKNNADSSGSK